MSDCDEGKGQERVGGCSDNWGSKRQVSCGSVLGQWWRRQDVSVMDFESGKTESTRVVSPNVFDTVAVKGGRG